MSLEATSEIAEKLGHYRLRGEAGRGGMSVVYEAVDERFGRRVALKALSLPLSLPADQRIATVARLKREARAVACLSHPNIVTIFDIGEERGRHFLVMEFLEGRTLRQRLNDGPLPPGEAGRVLDQVASALDAVHAAGIIHRDVKPSNVMLLPGGRVKLMDFGVARGSEDTLVTQAGMMVGSPAYMAPEQIGGGTLGPACDVWALGVLLYEMLAGRSPFAGKTIPNVVYQVMHDDPLRIPGVPPAVQAVLKRALAKNPAQRYPSARALADAYRAASAERAAPPVPAPPVPRPPAAAPAVRARRPLPPRPILWASGLLGLVLLAALPQALRPPRVPAPRVVIQRPPAPVVRVASERQEIIPAPVTQTPRRPRSHARPNVTPPTPVYTARTRSARRNGARRREARQRTVQARLALAARPDRPPAFRHPNRAESPVATIETPPAPIPVRPAQTAGDGPSLLGTWHGRHSHNPAELQITHQEGDRFQGTLSVRTREAGVRVAVEGRVSPGGAFSMHERRILSSTAPRAWDLGSESGRVAGDGRIAGTGTDIKGRHGDWSFSR